MIRAIHFPDRDAFYRQSIPGSFWLGHEETGTRDLWYFCPCGCGVPGRLVVGDGFKPEDGPSWHWNGSITEPALRPSVHHIGHWHGWLRNGYWEAC